MERPLRLSSSASLSLGLAAVLLFARATQAQDADLEEIIVTGSRIARPDFSSASPIVSIDAESFTLTASTSVETTVSRLPQFTPSYTSTSNNPANGGQGNVQLRGLGLTSTLVLLDGRRLIPANGTGVVDVNIIPTALVESVEVVTGGASAVYGSDAIAGVVNFRLRRSFDGVEFESGYGLTERSDGEEWFAGITGGLEFADARGSVYGHLSYSERESVDQAKRRYSQYTLGYVGPGAGRFGPERSFEVLGSPLIEEGATFQPSSPEAFDTVFSDYVAGGAPYQTRIGFNADDTLFTGGNGDPGSVVNFRGEKDARFFSDAWYTYNHAPYNYLQLPLERRAAFARGSFELGDAAELYGQALLSDYSSGLQLAPTPVIGLRVPVTNPYIPADLRTLLDSRANPGDPFFMVKRLSELGPRQSDVEYNVHQVTLGVRGQAAGRWDFDVHAQIGANDQSDTQTGVTRLSLLEELTFAEDGGLAACGGFNPFGLGRISAGCLSYISVDASNRQGFDQSVVEASVGGRLFELPAGELRAVFGALHKRDEFFYRADPRAAVFLPGNRPDLQGFNASQDIEGDDRNTDLYVELLLPLLSGARAAESLELGLGYRYSDYASAGGADSYKAEVSYRPIERLRVRTSYQRALRAPSVFELYSPQLPVNHASNPAIGLLDPCTAGSPQRSGADAARVEALCLAQGLSPELLDGFADSDGFIYGYAGGNPDLLPEQADTLTAGFVVQSRFTHPALRDLQLSVDWYRIEVEGAIGSISSFEFIPGCYDATINVALDPRHVYCTYLSRDPVTGDIDTFYDIDRNLAMAEASGVDIQVDWSLTAGPGQLSANWLVSWLDYRNSRNAAGLTLEEYAGTVGNFAGSSPEWKWNLTLGYEWRDFSLIAQWRHVDSMVDLVRFATEPLPSLDVPSYDYFDASASYAFGTGPLTGLVLRGGIENVTDKRPPLLPSAAQANTDPSQYDVLGRRYHLSLRYRF